MPAEDIPVTADELAERRKAGRRLRLIGLCESLAAASETAAAADLREAFARRYQALVGVPPRYRAAFRDALAARVGVTVDEIALALTSG